MPTPAPPAGSLTPARCAINPNGTGHTPVPLFLFGWNPPAPAGHPPFSKGGLFRCHWVSPIEAGAQCAPLQHIRGARIKAPLWEGVARLSRGGGLEKVDSLRRRLGRRQLPQRGSLGGAPAGASGYFFFFAFAQPFLRTGRAGFSFFSTRVRVSVRAFLSLTGWLLQGGAPGPPRPAGPLSGFTRQCLP